MACSRKSGRFDAGMSGLTHERTDGRFHENMQLSQLNNIEPIYNAISMLRDGSVIGPAEFFLPVGSTTL